MDWLVAHSADLLFYVFALGAVASALLVVSLRNPMYGAIALLTTFLSVAVLFFLRHAEFVGVVQIFVYGGGIMVLFLFVIMLVNLHRLREAAVFKGRQAGAAVAVVLLLVVLFAYLFAQVEFTAPAPGIDPQAAVAAFETVEEEPAGNTEAVAWELYRDYLLPFEIASLFLLVAMIGAVVLGRRQ